MCVGGGRGLSYEHMLKWSLSEGKITKKKGGGKIIKFGNKCIMLIMKSVKLSAD